MTSSTSTASVTTERPARYARQLASHLGRRVESSWDDESGQGWVDFGSGRVTLAAGDGVLLLGLVADDAENLERLEGVVGGHLVRFGAKDELVCAWTRTNGAPGTEHRNEGSGT